MEVLEADASSFKVNIADEGKVFVFGRQVSDFRTVDYEALTTLAISAIQQLNKENENLKQANTAMQKDNADMKASLSTLLNDVEMLKNIAGAKAVVE